MTSAARTRRRARALEPPEPADRLRVGDLLALAAANGLLILAMWIRHGGTDQLTSVGGALTAAGQLTALYGAYAVVLGLVLMARIPWLDELLGIERLAAAHRLVGFASAWLLVAHGILTTVGWSLGDGSSVVEEFVTLNAQLPYVLWATVALGLLLLVAVTSVAAARRRLSYDTWYGLHLYAYLAAALAFLHEVVVGTDFIDDAVARVYWTVSFVGAIALIAIFRVAYPIAFSLRHQLVVSNVVSEGPGATSVYLSGRDLDQLPAHSGQYFRYRFLTRDDWWHAHPFSLSAAPNGQFLRFTAVATGDWADRLAHVPLGTRVVIEGPYGHMTEALRDRRRVVLIGGGIGITPLRALAEDLSGPGHDVSVIYRVRRPEDAFLRDELEAISAYRGVRVHVVAGHRGRDLATDPLGPAALRRLVPDIRAADVFVCGPDGFIDTVRASLEALGVDPAHVHWERFTICERCCRHARPSP